MDVPNKNPVYLLFKDAPKVKGKFFVGESAEIKPVFANMEELCHVLVAGSAGSGKSVFLNTVICSLIQSPPSENQFVMISPAMSELSAYDGIPHLKHPVITGVEEAIKALEEATRETDKRYQAFKEANARNLSEYNEKANAPFPRLIVVIDELADLMMASYKKTEPLIVRIAQKGRAAGIHLIIATQRPGKNVLTGIIKYTIPSRIAFSMATALESYIILDEKGAETLCGDGDMIYKPMDGKPQRLQGAYISREEIERIMEEAKRH